jgi:hypothetical protein
MRLNIKLAPLQMQIDLLDEPAVLCQVTAIHNGFTVKGIGNMAYQMSVATKIELGVTYVDANNNPASVDGPVDWTVSDSTLGTIQPVTPLPPGYPENGVIMFVPVGPTGQVQVTASADVDMGAGVKPLATLLDINLLAGEAVAGTISPIGDPQPNP